MINLPNLPQNLQIALQTFAKGLPVLLYHNDEDEVAMVIAAESLTQTWYEFMRKYSTSDVSMMIDGKIANKLGLIKVSDAIKIATREMPLFNAIIENGHAGPTLDLNNKTTGSGDNDKVKVMSRFAQVAKNDNVHDFYKDFKTPGHVKTYIAQEKLMSKRKGHTELGVFLSKLADMSGIVCMVTLRDPDAGNILTLEESRAFGVTHQLPLIMESDLMEVFDTEKARYTGEYNYTKLDWFEYLRDVLFLREYEKLISRLFRLGKIRGSYHLSLGQEVGAVVSSRILKETDIVLTGHRGHHFALAKGIDPSSLLLEIVGNNQGLNGGNGGPMHMYSKEKGFWGANGIVGANVAIGTGIALGLKKSESDSVVVSVFGDGSTNEGLVHESMNIASLWNLPILFLCENNLYSQTTSLHEHSANPNLTESARVHYKIKSLKVENGNDVIETQETMTEAVEYVRKEKKPFFLEVCTYRTCGHSMSDLHQEYKDLETDLYWKRKDPLTDLERKYLDAGGTYEEIVNLRREIMNYLSHIEGKIS